MNKRCLFLDNENLLELHLILNIIILLKVQKLVNFTIEKSYFLFSKN